MFCSRTPDIDHEMFRKCALKKKKKIKINKKNKQ